MNVNEDDQRAMLKIVAGGWPQGYVRRTYIRDLNEAQKDLLERCGMQVRSNNANVIDFRLVPMGGGSSMVQVHYDWQVAMKEAAELN